MRVDESSVVDFDSMKIKYLDTQPCEHKGCELHLSHPCEECGRSGARGVIYEQPYQFDFDSMKKYYIRAGAENACSYVTKPDIIVSVSYKRDIKEDENDETDKKKNNKTV